MRGLALGLGNRRIRKGPELTGGLYALPAGVDNTLPAQTATSFSTTGGTTTSRVYLSLSATPVTKTFEVTYRLVSVSSGTVSVVGRNADAGAGGNLNLENVVPLTAGQTGRFVYSTNNTATSCLWVSSAVGASFSVDNISIKELISGS